MQATLEHVLENGIADLSLRGLASAIGTSHRLLSYHFGSKDELLDALIEALETTHSEALLDLERDPSMSPSEALLRTWDYITQPHILAHGRLALEIFALAFRERPGSPAFFSSFGRAWIDPLVEFSRRSGVPADRAEVDGHIALAMIRGLLLEFAVSGDSVAPRTVLQEFLRQRDEGVRRDKKRGKWATPVSRREAIARKRLPVKRKRPPHKRKRLP